MPLFVLMEGRFQPESLQIHDFYGLSDTKPQHSGL